MEKTQLITQARHPDAELAQPPCARCVEDGLVCLRRPSGVGKCYTCTSDECPFVPRTPKKEKAGTARGSASGSGKRGQGEGFGEGQAGAESPNPGAIRELFQVVDHIRSTEPGSLRTYLVQRARELARSAGLELRDILPDLDGEQEASGSGSAR
jgi:hypothetical protein